MLRALQLALGPGLALGGVGGYAQRAPSLAPSLPTLGNLDGSAATPGPASTPNPSGQTAATELYPAYDTKGFVDLARGEVPGSGVAGGANTPSAMKDETSSIARVGAASTASNESIKTWLEQVPSVLNGEGLGRCVNGASHAHTPPPTHTPHPTPPTHTPHPTPHTPHPTHGPHTYTPTSQWVYGTGVAMFRVGWTWNRKQNEVELVLEQEKPPWRGTEASLSQAEGGAQDMFVGSIVVRVVSFGNPGQTHLRPTYRRP